MDTTESKLSFRAECEVFYGDEVFTEKSDVQISVELEENEDYSDSCFSNYKKMYQATLDHLNVLAEKTWGKFEPPTSINLKITPIQ
ncbi:MAG: hypothetical protein JJU05_11810 [Verrucomicrobia bacterium]|nr:hypothetical protein [Verrucomicrobiota bacterium]MCH8528067.1 hypothetical protein [Kiritimatiellia bacterium]